MRRLLRAVKNYWFSYRGAERWSADRGFVPGWVQDARFDASEVTRLELVRKSRSFEKNSGIYNRLCDLFEQFTVGHNGLQIIPASSDEAWNQAATEVFNEWQNFCDLTSKQHFSILQSQIARAWFQDGEVFLLKTRGYEGSNPIPRPRIQVVETQRVETPDDMMIAEGQSIFEGIEVNPDGRPLAYWVKDGFSDPVHRRKPAEFVIHVGEPSRTGQLRPLPFCYPVINDITDLDDLQILEMRAAKDASEKSTFFLTETGELKQKELRRSRYSAATQLASGATDPTTGAGAEISEARVAEYRKLLGGRSFALKKGEDVKQFVPTRPSVAVQEYWDYLLSKVCIGIGIPRLLVMPPSQGQGTIARAELDMANGFFRSRSAVLSNAFTQVWLYVMDWHIKNDPRVKNAPADWRKVSVRAPRAVNVDVGRNAAAAVQQLDAGLINYDMLYSELGLDWRQQMEQKAREAAYIKTLAAKYGVELNDIAERIPLKQAKGGGGDSQTVAE